jgi:hypothetical protein
MAAREPIQISSMGILISPTGEYYFFLGSNFPQDSDIFGLFRSTDGQS